LGKKGISNARNKFLKSKNINDFDYYAFFDDDVVVDKKWLIEDPENMIKSIGGWDNMMKEEFYEYMMKSLDEQRIKKIYIFFKNFLKSNYQSINIEDTSRIKIL